MAKQASGGLAAIGAALDKSKPAPKVGGLRAIRDDDISEAMELPPGCPVKAIGKIGQLCFYLDEQRQMIGLKPIEHGKTHILNLFGRKSYMCEEYWPRYGKTGEINGWKPEDAAKLLMAASANAGIFDPQGKIHGRGAHLGRDGELVLHCGDVLFRTGPEGGYVEPGFVNGLVYPTAPEIPRPDPEPATTETAELLRMLLSSWKWARPLIDPMLLLGWVGCAIVGGALQWRPHAWITGSSATGKSTLQKLLEHIFDGGALHTQDATEASLRQLLKMQTLPVFFDELEAGEDNRRAKAVINLARLASSGGEIFRGGQDHEGHTFKAKTCFLFSSILLPPMLAQDRNRLAMLELEKFPAGSVSPTFDTEELRLWGRKLRRRLCDQWHRLPELLDRYRAALNEVGHGGRSQDQFGTLLAMADLMLYDVSDDEVIADTAGWLNAATLAEKAVDLADEEEAVQFLASSFLQQRGGDEPAPIARHIKNALDLEDGKPARDRLENFGMKIVERTESAGKVGAKAFSSATEPATLYLAIANSHVGLARIFQSTRWSEGTWTQSFARVERAERRVKVRFGPGNATWATLIPLAAMLDLSAEPA